MKQLGRPIELQHPKSTSIVFEEADLRAFKEIAARQGESMGFLIRGWVKDYVKAHKENSQTGMDTFTDHPELKAYPTPYATIGTKELAPYDSAEIEDMMNRVQKSLDAMGVARQTKRAEEMKKRVNHLAKNATPGPIYLASGAEPVSDEEGSA